MTLQQIIPIQARHVGDSVKQGAEHAGRGRHDEALMAYEEALSADRRNIRALRGKIAALVALCRWTEAIDAADEALSLHPMDAGLRVSRGWVLSEQDHAEEALRQFEEACEMDPDNEEVLQAKAAQLRYMRRWHEAEEAARAIIRLPDSADGRVMLAWVLFDMGRRDDAEREVDEAISHSRGHHSWGLSTKTQFLAMQQRWEEAEKHGYDAINKLPDDLPQRSALCDVLRGEGRYEDAREHAKKAFSVNPVHPKALSDYIQILKELHEFGSAEDEARKVVAEHRRSVDAHTVLAQLLDGLCRPAEALKSYDDALALNPRFEPAIIGKSSALRGLGRLDDAQRFICGHLERASYRPFLVEQGMIELERGIAHPEGDHFRKAEMILEDLLERESVSAEEEAEVLEQLGWVAFEGEDYRKAAERFKAARERDPMHAARYWLGSAWISVRDENSNYGADGDPRLHIAEFLDHTPSDPLAPLAHSWRGVMAFRDGEYAAAEQYFQQAVELAPCSSGHVALGALYREMGLFKESLESLERAEDCNENDASVHIELGHLHLERSESPEDAEAAAWHFRRARMATANRKEKGDAALGLAVAVVRSRGDLKSAEETLRTAIHVGDDVGYSTGKLNQALARVLVQAGDAVPESAEQASGTPFYDDALSAAKAAVLSDMNDPESYFVAGVVEQRLASQTSNAFEQSRHRKNARHYFEESENHHREEGGKYEARRAAQLLGESSFPWMVGATVAGPFVVLIVALVLLATWVDFLWGADVTTTMVMTLTPVLLGLIFAGFLLPKVISLKLPGGVEASLAEDLSIVPNVQPKVMLNASRFTPSSSFFGSPSQLRWRMPKAWATRYYR
ncbi:tetratricopeptide repeat protein [Streptomyces sp. NPDC006372]|uniref:tetratricopeptide repeat protein n=1 Tax=Streptomyces sp. NPDC006372 TaxID=3155599 RepID=UPI0033A3C76E